jgi:hypothetical protein
MCFRFIGLLLTSLRSLWPFLSIYSLLVHSSVGDCKTTIFVEGRYLEDVSFSDIELDAQPDRNGKVERHSTMVGPCFYDWVRHGF